MRYVIETLIRIGEEQWPVELTLTNRDEMGFRMLVGRSAMSRRLIVDPARSFCSTFRPKRASRRGARGQTDPAFPADEEE
jgi:hypothetical protein